MTAPPLDTSAGSRRAAVLGQGAREHALAWFLRRAGWQVWASAAHPGLAQLCRPLPVELGEPSALAAACADLGVELVVIGPEAPLVAGMADELRRCGVAVLGPGRDGARLEGSKIFAKRWMVRHGLPTAPFAAFDAAEPAWTWAQRHSQPPVIKADGLAGGKGVRVPETWAECREALQDLLVARRCGEAGAAVVVEQRLQGPELSAIALVGGGHFALLPPARDHKRALDRDQGPQTGGMGAVAPVPGLDSAAWQQVAERVMAPAVRALQADQLDYRGALYAGLLWTEAGPQILEFNVRFGDPEAQALLPLLDPAAAELLARAARGDLQRDEVLPLPPRCSAAVVVAAEGYPGAVTKGAAIAGLDLPEARSPAGSSLIFQGSVARHPSGGSAVAGGRVVTAVGVADRPEEARRLAYLRARQIDFPGAWVRSDIGAGAAGPSPQPP